MYVATPSYCSRHVDRRRLLLTYTLLLVFLVAPILQSFPSEPRYRALAGRSSRRRSCVKGRGSDPRRTSALHDIAHV